VHRKLLLQGLERRGANGTKVMITCTALVSFSVLVWSGSNLRVNLSGSIPLGIYRVVSEAPERGSTVLFCLPKSVAIFARDRGYLRLEGNCPGHVSLIGKPVLALPGDTIVVTRNAGLSVNGVLLPNSRALVRDDVGRILPPLPDGRYLVPPGRLWVASSYSVRSFDSRYFGSVAESSVQSVIRPIWTATNSQ